MQPFSNIERLLLQSIKTAMQLIITCSNCIPYIVEEKRVRMNNSIFHNSGWPSFRQLYIKSVKDRLSLASKKCCASSSHIS